MWRCICGIEESLASSEALSCRSTTGKYLVAGLSEQLAQYGQLVVQLIDQYPDKETQLQVRDEHLKLLEDLKVKLCENEEALLEKTQLVDVLQKKLNRNNRDLALLEDFNKKLWEREEELRETTEHVKVLQTKLERKNCVIMELVEDVRKLEDKNEDLDNQYYAEDYASHIKICGLRATHKAELTNLKEQVTLLYQEAARSEESSLSMEASYLSKIGQIQEELDNVQLVSAQKLLLEHKDAEIDYEEEDDQLYLKVNWPQYVEAQNEKLQKILETYEEQYQNMQISESESAEELVKWQETDYKPTTSHDNNEWTVMELKMNQVEEKKEDLISELQELEEEVGDLQIQGQGQGWTTQATAGQKLMEKEELESMQQSTQQERREQDPSCKNELAELRHVRPALGSKPLKTKHTRNMRRLLRMTQLKRWWWH
ncbi:golgin subfamily A member 6-like protein 2 [Leucoraja erinacea]|uniref:golgin subfamily A member 6-like protein 2 n=1 Tax=Leucoraja erinaceus TaxID=7782 RepID=UPI00245513E2|nr:golgin subfamily A member 6-like protein 2 [Leucoraja erinacea]XP_055486269.1 golgin subfamily A member 6-like protein 2 [Leucoraja erinacea]